MLEILRAGRQLDMNGRPWEFTVSDLEELAASYNPELHEAPILQGHDESKPNRGLIGALEVQGDRLIARPHRVEPKFAEDVNAGRWPKLSPALYTPSSPVNPTPGRWYLRHLAAVQIPAIKGMASPAFAEAADCVCLFAEADGSIAMLARRLRDFLLGEFDGETADRYLPAYLVESLEATVAEPMPSFSEVESMPENLEATGSDTLAGEAQDTLKAAGGDTLAGATSEDLMQELYAREAQLREREAALAAKEREAELAADAAFCEGLVSEGKLPPFMRDTAATLLGCLSASDSVQFSEGEANPKDKFKEFLAQVNAGPQFGEMATPATAPKPKTARAVAERARQLVAEGRYSSVADAVNAVYSGAA